MSQAKRRSRVRFSSPITRRRCLLGLGGISLGLPWLEQLQVKPAQAQQSTGPKRVISVAYSMGVPLGHWRPSAVGDSFTLPYVTEPLAAFQDRCLFVSAIDNRVLDAGGDSFVWGHPAKKEAALTGTLTTGAFPTGNNNLMSEIRADAVTDGGANAESVEQIIGNFLNNGHAMPSVNLGVDGGTMPDYGGREPIQPSEYFFEGRGNAISMNLFPHLALDSIFAGIGADDAPSEQQLALQRLRFRNKSVLDAVRDSFTDLSQGLGADDQRRLQEHADRIRQLELEVRVAEACSVPAALSPVDTIQGLRMDELAPSQIRILAHAMGCDLAPVGRLEFMNQQNPRFGIEALDSTLDAAGDTYDWHGMVHGDPLPGTEAFLRPGRGDEQEYDSRLLDGYRYFVQQFADLLAELDAMPEGPDSSVLDNSMVILASDLGEGLGHGHMKMGYILAGNLGSARTGYHFDAGPAGETFEPGGGYFYSESSSNVSQLLNSMLDMASVVDGAGQPAQMGLGGYLESVGAARRIDGLFA